MQIFPSSINLHATKALHVTKALEHISIKAVRSFICYYWKESGLINNKMLA